MSNYPVSLHTKLTLLDNVDDVLATHPNTLSDELYEVQAKLGVDSSSVNTTIDYFLKHVSGAYRTHTHDGSSDDGVGIPVANLVGTIQITQGGTGSTSKNFVDLTTGQSVAGVKTFSDIPVFTGFTVGANSNMGNFQLLGLCIENRTNDSGCTQTVVSGSGRMCNMQATGGSIATNGSSKVHTFTSSGNFTFYGVGTVKVLVIGGGANSPYSAAGGCGGAGQVVYNASYSITTGIYTVTVGGIQVASSFGTITANTGSGSTSGSGKVKGNNAGGTYGSAYGGGGGSGANGGNASFPVIGYQGGMLPGPGTFSDITGTNIEYACGGSGGPSGGGSNFSGLHGTRLYGDGQGSNASVYHALPPLNPCPALPGVVIISYVYSSMDSGLRIGGESIAFETLDTHKLRLNKNGTIVGLPLVATTSALASKTRIYDGSSVKALVKLP